MGHVFRSLLVLAAVTLALASPASTARAAAGDEAAPVPSSAPFAKIDCPRVSDPGRVRCEVEVRPPPGATIRWADVVIVAAPPFALSLRARVGPREAAARDEGVWRWAIALAAKAHGEGDLAARVHLVACRGPDACAPYEVDVTARVAVGL